MFLLNFQLGNAQAAGMEAGSWGGKVRSGPGKEFTKIGSLNNGDPVTLIEGTKIFLDGYEWFKIIYDNNSVGYQWGEICVDSISQFLGLIQCARWTIEPVQSRAGIQTIDGLGPKME